MGRTKSKTTCGCCQGHAEDNGRTDTVARSERNIPIEKGKGMIVLTA